MNEYNNITYKKLNDICTVLSKSTKKISDAQNEGLFKFYTKHESIQKYCHIPDYTDECIIFNINKPDIRLVKDFSCSVDFIIVISDNIQYIYYWLISNMDILTNIFTTTNKKLTKNDILLIDIPFPPEEVQQHIIKQFEHNNRKIEILEIEIKQLKSTNIPKQILTILNNNLNEFIEDNLLDKPIEQVITVSKTKTKFKSKLKTKPKLKPKSKSKSKFKIKNSK